MFNWLDHISKIQEEWIKIEKETFSIWNNITRFQDFESLHDKTNALNVSIHEMRKIHDEELERYSKQYPNFFELSSSYLTSLEKTIQQLEHILDRLNDKSKNISYTWREYKNDIKQYNRLVNDYHNNGKKMNTEYSRLQETSTYDSNDVESSVVNAIIEVCYAYDTTPYINSLEKTCLDGLTPADKKALDPVLSCLSLGIAIRFLNNKYGKKSEDIIKKLLDRVYSAVLSATNSTDTSAENVANFYVELISNYSIVLDYDAVDVIDYGMGVCEKVFEPVEELFEQLKPDPQIALYIMTIIPEFGANIRRITETAEEKYNYSPSVK